MRVSSYALATTLVVLGLPGIGCSDSSKTITDPTLGLLSVAVATTGASIDVPGGFLYAVDGGSSLSIGVNAAVMYGNVTAGKHDIEIKGLPANCSSDGGSKRSVNVIAGGNVTLAFAVTCLPNTGTLTLTTVTHGSITDLDHYAVELPGIGPVELDANGTRTFENVRAGSFRVTLTTAPTGCQLSGFPSADVEFRASTAVVLVVQCSSDAQLASIAYVSGTSGNADIHVITPNGVDRRITTQAGADVDPAWSPDHSKIAFASDRDGRLDIYVMNADGTDPVRLTTAGVANYSPAWSPDGERIAFVSERDRNPEIYAMDADGRNQTRLTNDANADLEPDWSPDGKRIAFHRDNWQTDAINGIYTMRSDGTDVKQLTVSYRGDWEPAWSPDGGKIVFARASFYTTDLYIVNADGTGELQLTSTLPFVTGPTWSPDGVYIAFASVPSGDDGSKSDILVMDSNGSSAKPIKASAPASNPAWR